MGGLQVRRTRALISTAVSDFDACIVEYIGIQNAYIDNIILILTSLGILFLNRTGSTYNMEFRI